MKVILWKTQLKIGIKRENDESPLENTVEDRYEKGKSKKKYVYKRKINE